MFWEGEGVSFVKTNSIRWPGHHERHLCDFGARAARLNDYPRHGRRRQSNPRFWCAEIGRSIEL